MTGLSPEQRLDNHLRGIKAARVVTKFGVRLVPTLYEHLNPLTYQDAVRLEWRTGREPAQARLPGIRRALSIHWAKHRWDHRNDAAGMSPHSIQVAGVTSAGWCSP